MDGPLSSHNGERRAPGPCNAQARPVPAKSGAFTLLEVLTVVAIIVLLAAVAFTATGGAMERGRLARCRCDLAVLSQALEDYRSHYGEYPQTGLAANDPSGTADAGDGPGILFNALAGRRGPGALLVPVDGRCFLQPAAFALQTGELPRPGNSDQVANAFLDPWGRRYLYFYKCSNSWMPRSALLCSAGPDGALELPADLATWDGTMPAAAANSDNLSASEP